MTSGPELFFFTSFGPVMGGSAGVGVVVCWLGAGGIFGVMRARWELFVDICWSLLLALLLWSWFCFLFSFEDFATMRCHHVRQTNTNQDQGRYGRCWGMGRLDFVIVGKTVAREEALASEDSGVSGGFLVWWGLSGSHVTLMSGYCWDNKYQN